MNATLRTAGVLILTAMFTSACATKKWVRTTVGDERAMRMAADSSVRTELSGEINGVKTDLSNQIQTVKGDVASLRNDLNALRTEFGAKITAMEEGMKFAFPVNFAFDDATVREEDKAALDRFAAIIQKYYGGSAVTIEGHADPAGSARYNQELSKRRADAVASYLGEKGLSSTSLKTVGYGKARLVNKGAQKDDPGAEQNRRVVFVVETRGSAAVAVAQP